MVVLTVDATKFDVEVKGEEGDISYDPVTKTFEVNTKEQPRTIRITVKEKSGSRSETYVIWIKQPNIPFLQIVQVRWNNTLTVKNNPSENGGYTFKPNSYKWYRNGVLISEGSQSWSAGSDGEPLNESDVYHVQVETSDGTILTTCASNLLLKSMRILAYPNPVIPGRTLYVDADVDEDLLTNAVIEVYNVMGNRVDRFNVQGRITTIDVNYGTGVYLFVLRGKDGFNKELKIIVGD
jgi:hypothetical protein